MRERVLQQLQREIGNLAVYFGLVLVWDEVGKSSTVESMAGHRFQKHVWETNQIFRTETRVVVEHFGYGKGGVALKKPNSCYLTLEDKINPRDGTLFVRAAEASNPDDTVIKLELENNVDSAECVHIRIVCAWHFTK